MGDREPDFGKADLTNCDREPIHIPGAIQPHGVLLALDAASLKVVQIAGDTERLLGIRPCDMLGRASLEASIGPAQLDHLRAMLAKARPIPRPMFAFETVVQRGTATLDAIVHLTDGIVVVELEPRLGEAIGNPLMLVQEMVNGLQQAASVGAFLQAVADQVRASTGFDRVMVYKFQPDDSGAVIAEARGGDVESFLGLHYPASDIPKQARRLYLQNWMRLIPDARYTPAPLTPALNPITNQPLDLTSSVLRSVSPIHLEYLANMGVVASMSLSLVVDGKLWGLIACHHAAPKYLPHTLRSACELFVEMASLQLAEKIAREEQRDRLRANAVHALLVEAMSQEHRLAEALIRHRPNLLDYIPAESVAIWSDAELTTEGRAPSNEQISHLIAWLNDNVGEGVFVSDHLSEHYPPAKEYADVASGLIALSISRSPRDYVLWFRPEVIETITWAGNPDKPVEAHGGSERLSPRKSFAAWRETVRGRSRAWGPCQLEAAQALRTSILEVVLRRLDQVAHERDKARGQQDMLMAELDHRVKNIIALIQSLAEYSAAGAENLESFTRVFRQRLQALGNAQNLLSDGRWKGAPLRTIIEEGAAPFGDGRVFVSGPMLVVRPKAALSLALAMHELATNASKYGALQFLAVAST